ncbi:hypothetical protein Cgig2_001681 [Carnegiea gigantea]|uniref:Uncharacterized protein n=1 Tax=Carnegiea gigantea TaxID=171969 RepID=A0A9Q1JTC3_9CARY|nr:hypothetical protein Cgig2_001681 [Carnegiea gigantea]
MPFTTDEKDNMILSRRNKNKRVKINEHTDYKKPKWEVGMTFGTMQKFKQAMIIFALVQGYDLTFNVSDISCAAWLKEDPAKFVHPYWHKEHYLKPYEGAIFPWEGERHWPQHDFPLDPSDIIIGPRRLWKNRKRDPHKDLKKPGKLSRHEKEAELQAEAQGEVWTEADRGRATGRGIRRERTATNDNARTSGATFVVDVEAVNFLSHALVEFIPPAIYEDGLGDEEIMLVDSKVATHGEEGNEVERAGGSDHGEDPDV